MIEDSIHACRSDLEYVATSIDTWEADGSYELYCAIKDIVDRLKELERQALSSSV